MNFSRDLFLDDTLRDVSRRWRKFVYARKLRASWSMEEQEENVACRISLFASSMSTLHHSETRLD